MKPMQPMKPMAPMQAPEAWWPGDLGTPNSSGAQNQMRYAYFEGSHRLAVDSGGEIEVYDTGSHRINGFAQQQGASGTLSFSSNDGTVDLASLKAVG